VPAQTGPEIDPDRQTGHGCVLLPVRIVFEFSGKFQLATPVEMSRVPLGPAPENVFSTQVVLPPFGMGSGVPKRQPAAVQS
jgi:hypothetical protein